MPLHDHFHTPLPGHKTWGEVYGQWPAEIVRPLFSLLPDGYSASPPLHLGLPFDINVSSERALAGRPDDGSPGVATLAPFLTVEANLSDQDEFEVRVFDEFRRLVAAIELVSPANKDRPDSRRLFTGKCAALLRQDVCVVIVDVVTVRQANLYAELLARFGQVDPRLGKPLAPPVRRHPPRTEAEEATVGARPVVLHAGGRPATAHRPALARPRPRYRTPPRTGLPGGAPAAADFVVGCRRLPQLDVPQRQRVCGDVRIVLTGGFQ